MKLLGRWRDRGGVLPTPDPMAQSGGEDAIPGDRGPAEGIGRRRPPVGAMLLVSAGCLAVIISFVNLSERPARPPLTEVAASPLAPDRDRKAFRDRDTTLPLVAPPPPLGGPPVLPQFTPPPLPRIEPREGPQVGTSQERSRILTPQERRLQGGVDGMPARRAPSVHRVPFDMPPAAVDRPSGAAPSEPGGSLQSRGVRSGSSPAFAGTGLLSAGLPISGSVLAPVATGAGPEEGAPDRAGFDGQLQATRTRGASAALLPSMTMMLARGRLFECTLDTAIASGVAGQVRCTVPLDVYGEDGRVVLLDRGSEIVGEYRSDLRRAQKRMGILWTRAKTPFGVLIDLDSPASDSLGRAGVAGHVDTHFWERFGAALMLSVLDDALAAVLRDSRGTQNYYGNTERAGRRLAEIALQDSINIPPTLVKNQGETVQVFLARDLDFRTIYDYRQLGVR